MQRNDWASRLGGLHLLGHVRASEAYPFAEPWEAEAFAIVVILKGRNVFTPTEWSEALSSALRRREMEGHAHAEKYYDCLLETLVALLVSRDIASVAEIDDLAAAWMRAAAATPHGRPIELGNDPSRAST